VTHRVAGGRVLLKSLSTGVRLALAGVLGLVLLAVPMVQTAAQSRAAPTDDPMLRIETPMHQALIRRLAVDAGGERWVTAGDDKTIRIWQLLPAGASATAPQRTARLVQTLRVPIDRGHEGQLFALAVSPDGTRIAAGGWTCWDWERAGCVYVFDATSGEIVRRLRGLPDAVSALAWSPDGRHLAIGLQGRAGIRIWRTDAFEEVAADRAFGDKVMELAYDPAGRLAAVALDGRIRLYRADHRLLGRLAVPGGQQPATVRFSPDGQRLAVGFLDSAAVSILGAENLQLLQLQATRRVDDPAQRNLSNVAWSLDGSTLVAAGERSTEGPNVVYRWRGSGWAERDAWPIPAQRVSELQALPGQAVAFAAEDPRLGIVDVQGRIVLDREADISDFSDARFVLRASSDGATIGFTRSDGQEQRFDAQAAPGAGSPTAGSPPPPMAAAITALPGWQLDRGPDRLSLRVNGRQLRLDDDEIVRTWALPAAGDALFLGTEWSLRRLDAQGSETWRVRLSAIVRAVVVSGNAQWVIAALSDGTVRWFRARDGAETLAYFAHAGGEDWIAWTPSGYYMSSLQGDQYVGWHVNRGADRAPDFHRAVQFERVLYRPDIVTAALRVGARPQSRQVGAPPPRFDQARLAQMAPPRLAVQVLGVDRGSGGTARARLRITGERGAQPLRDLTVYVNDIPVTPAHDRRVGWTESSRVVRELEVPLSAGSNDIRVESFTEVAMGVAERWVSLDGSEAADARPRASGDLYVLAIGNNRFPNLPPAAHLEFAARDAEALAAALATPGVSTFRRVHQQVLADGRSQQAHRQSVLDALAFTRQARAEDTVVVFLASHGVSDRSGNYWFVPRDATAEDLKAVEDSAADRPVSYPSLLSWSVFFDALRETAGRRLLIVDTCQAKGMEGRFESFSLLKRSAASRFSLMVAAQSNEESQEYPPGKHGLFTYALLQALSPGARGGSADTDGDGRISIAEAFAQAAPVVARLHDRALGSQTPALIAPPALSGSPLVSARPE
jgi:dipeptidyl aminopeptidase/acylaminoacyl peptidase